MASVPRSDCRGYRMYTCGECARHVLYCGKTEEGEGGASHTNYHPTTRVVSGKMKEIIKAARPHPSLSAISLVMHNPVGNCRHTAVAQRPRLRDGRSELGWWGPSSRSWRSNGRWGYDTEYRAGGAAGRDLLIRPPACPDRAASSSLFLQFSLVLYCRFDLKLLGFSLPSQFMEDGCTVKDGDNHGQRRQRQLELRLGFQFNT
jgi:hypothetical protein